MVSLSGRPRLVAIALRHLLRRQRLVGTATIARDPAEAVCPPAIREAITSLCGLRCAAGTVSVRSLLDARLPACSFFRLFALLEPASKALGSATAPAIVSRVELLIEGKNDREKACSGRISLYLILRKLSRLCFNAAVSSRSPCSRW